MQSILLIFILMVTRMLVMTAPGGRPMPKNVVVSVSILRGLVSSYMEVPMLAGLLDGLLDAVGLIDGLIDALGLLD